MNAVYPGWPMRVSKTVTHCNARRVDGELIDDKYLSRTFLPPVPNSWIHRRPCAIQTGYPISALTECERRTGNGKRGVLPKPVSVIMRHIACLRPERGIIIEA